MRRNAFVLLPILLLLGGCGPNNQAAEPADQIAENVVDSGPAQVAVTPAPAPSPSIDPIAAAATVYAESEPPMTVMEGSGADEPPKYFDVIDWR